MASEDGFGYGYDDGGWGDRRFLEAFELAMDALAPMVSRFCYAITAVGFVIAGSNMIEKAPAFGYVSLGVSGVFAVMLLVPSAKKVTPKR